MLEIDTEFSRVCLPRTMSNLGNYKTNIDVETWKTTKNAILILEILGKLNLMMRKRYLEVWKQSDFVVRSIFSF